MLTKKALILAKIEANYGSDPTPTPALNSVLVFDPAVNVNSDKLDRDVVRPSLTKLPHLIGKKFIEFTFMTELKGSGLLGTSPEIADLILACGYAETYGALGAESLNEPDFATHAKWDVAGDFDDSGGDAAYTDSSHAGTLTQTSANMAVVGVANKRYAFTYIISGKSGDAVASITSAFALEATSLDLTDGTHTVYFIAAPGAATADFVISATSSTGGFTMDDVTLKAVGEVVYTPASSSLSSVTIWVYLDGLLQKISGCRGSFEFTGDAGAQPRIAWTFQGLYQTPTDAAIPSGSAFDSTKGPVFMGATFTYGAYAAIIQQLQINLNNELAQRESVIASHGIEAIEIVGRAPGGSINPEAVLEATRSWWSNWEDGDGATLNAVIGGTAGNIITFDSDASGCVKESIAWGDRNGVRIYDIPFGLYGSSGDDELVLTFT